MIAEKDFIKIAQISDLHLLKSKYETIHQVNPYKRAAAIISFLKKKNYNLIIISGDIANNGEIESYEQLATMLNGIETKIILFPGNHDNPNNLESILTNNKNYIISPKNPIIISTWKFLYVDTVVKQKNYGHISYTAIERLKKTLSSNKEKNICLLMHHNPFNIGIDCVDKYKIDNFNNTVGTLTENVKLILHGHVHSNYFLLKEGIIYSAPLSTSFQFSNHNDTIDTKIFGFKEYTLTGSEIFCNPIILLGDKYD